MFIHFCMFENKIIKNSIKPEEDLSVIPHTCRQLATAVIAIRSRQPQIVFLKHQAATTLMQSGLSSATALIAGIPALGICVRAATHCEFNNLTSSQRRADRTRGLSACRQQDLKKKKDKLIKCCLRHAVQRTTSLATPWDQKPNTLLD